ncbi:MAG: chemotaxis response regulator protein-glutamate methylesterase [Nitrospirae bacterium]|nr:chemotaxis response regulator protein-glutamate methylesterase [Nitrospirota bacterium]
MKTKVLIVDDSALIRRTLTEILGSDPGIEVVGAAADPYFARDAIKRHNPDVLTLDIEMPRMDGITFLEKLMRLHPMPVVVVSSLAAEHADVTVQALALGAVTCIEKPKIDLSRCLHEQARELIEAVKAAAGSRVRPIRNRPAPAALNVSERHSVDEVLPAKRAARFATSDQVVAIGSSTGGTVALGEILEHMPPDCPGIVIVQHMPGGFTKSLANTLDKRCTIEVREARDGDRILPGLALLAPGGTHHATVVRNGANYHVKLIAGPRVDRHIPSVNVLFRSMAQEVGANGVGAILTGMGDDGADGMLEMRQSGVHTIAQDEASCVVFGMPKEAISRGGVDEVVTLTQIAPAIIKRVRTQTRV